jgi:hypothetical protein
VSDTIEVRVKVRNDTAAGLSAVRRDARSAGRDAGDGFAGGALPGFGQVSAAAGGAGRAMTTAGSAGSAMGPLIAAAAITGASAIARLAGAALALPGIFAAAGAAAAALNIGMSGVGAAISAMGTKPSGGGGGGGGDGGAAAAAQRQIRDAIDSVNDARKREKQVAEDTARSISRAERNKARVAVDSARDIAAAKHDEERAAKQSARSIEDALDAERAATENLNDAREDAARKLDDLREKVSDYALDEDGARLRVLAAYAAQRKVNGDSQSTNLEKAQALQNVREAEERLSDIQRDRAADTAKLTSEESKGVEGSDEVVAARKRLEDAEQGVADAKDQAAERMADAEQRVADAIETGAERQAAAQESLDDTIRESERQREAAHEAVADALQNLKDAQDQAGASAAGAAGGTNAYADALAKLSPNARAFVEALRELKPEWDAITKRVQDRMFAGLAAEITELAGVYFPVLDVGLQNVAAGFNAIFVQTSQGLMDPAVVDAVRAIMDDTAAFLTNAAPGIAAFVQGFLELAEVGASYLPQIGTWVAEIGEHFKSWVESGIADGTFTDFITDAGVAFRDLWDIATLVAEAIGAILSGLGFGGKGGDGGLLVALKESAKNFKEFVESDGVQSCLRLFGDHLPLVNGVLAHRHRGVLHRVPFPGRGGRLGVGQHRPDHRRHWPVRVRARRRDRVHGQRGAHRAGLAGRLLALAG